MRRRVVLVLLMALTLTLSVAVAPVAAAEKPVGDKISLLAGSTEFTANEPFHIIHGWNLLPNEAHPPAMHSFALDVDGVDQGRGKLLVSNEDGVMKRLSLFNFEDGLAPGTYTFTGHASVPCTIAVEHFAVAGPCPKRNVPVEVLTFSLTVTFS